MICKQCEKEKEEHEMKQHKKRIKQGRMTITTDEIVIEDICKECTNLNNGKAKRKRDNELGSRLQRALKTKEETSSIYGKVKHNKLLDDKKERDSLK